MASTDHRSSPRTRLVAVAIGLLVFLVYNGNGREIEVGDSVPSRLAARELVLRGTFTLDAAVREHRDYEGWPCIILTRDRHFRSAYSFLPPLEAAVVGRVLQSAGVVDMAAPLGAAAVAKLTASFITACTCVLAFLTARRRTSITLAACVALGLGLGTGLWPTVSQTLWQHETAIFGLMAAVWLFDRQTDRPGPVWLIGLALGVAGMARAQLAPAIAILALGAWWQQRSWTSLRGLWTLAACGIGTAALGIAWFGSPLGPRVGMLAEMTQTHAVSGTVNTQPWLAALGLLLSPNRGILVFSPIVAVVFAAIGASRRRRGTPAPGLRWLAGAAFAQFITYCFFSVWWAGYTYGPRYALDVLPLLVPAAAVGLTRLARSRVAAAFLILLMLWSASVSAIGAFYYDADIWNWDDNGDVDRRPERVWNWRDWQVRACLNEGLHRANFQLFQPGALTSSTPR